MHSQLEVERKFTVDEDFDLTSVRLCDGVRLVHDGVFQLRATYYDTTDLRLAAEGITLRRRAGGTDDGWQLKLPHGPDEREEVHEPVSAGETEPPASLRGLVLAHLRGETLQPVAQITTSRVVHRLVGDERGGPVLAELVDDHVTAEVCGDEAISTAWREVEAELVEGDADLLRAVTAALEGAGASRAVAGSKLERALGGRVLPRRQTPEGLGRDSDAAAVALAYLRQQVAAIMAADPLVRLDAEDAVHQMRVASRRLRVALTTFRPQLARGHTDALRGELRWLAGLLGDVRDAEVLRDRLRGRFDAAPPGPGTAAARAHSPTVGPETRHPCRVVRVDRELPGHHVPTLDPATGGSNVQLSRTGRDGQGFLNSDSPAWTLRASRLIAHYGAATTIRTCQAV